MRVETGYGIVMPGVGFLWTLFRVTRRAALDAAERDDGRTCGRTWEEMKAAGYRCVKVRIEEAEDAGRATEKRGKRPRKAAAR